MEQLVIKADALDHCSALPVSFVPTPSAAYRAHRKTVQLTQQPGTPHLTQATPAAPGVRVLLWKQDPSVAEIGTRKTFLPGVVLQGPRDARISFGAPGIAAVSANAFGDFIAVPDTDQFDAIHTFAIVRQTLTMYQRALASASGADGAPMPWQWNHAANTEPLRVFPHGLPDVMNAYYSREDQALKFGDFVPSGATARVFTCRSLDIVAHETGHAILDGLKPRWLLSSNPPQTGGLHESFGDLTAIFLTLSQLDQVEAVIAQTKANLHDKTFLADVAEQLGLALGRPNGLRNADNDLTLSETGTEVHAIAQVFTGAIYDILSDLFAFERRPGIEDDAAVLHRVAADLRSLVLRAMIAAPDSAATFADVANAMLAIGHAEAMPAPCRDAIRNRFTLRQVLMAAPAMLGIEAEPSLCAAHVQDQPGAQQDRRACCGTMNHAQYAGLEDLLHAERQALASWCRVYGHGPQQPAPALKITKQG